MALKILMQAVAAFACLYLLLIGVVAMRQRTMIYHPNPHRPDPAEADVAEMVPVPLKADDGWYASGWYTPPKGGPDKPTILLFHGNSGTVAGAAFKARRLMDAGYGVFMVEYRGFGGNAGHPTEQGLYADGRAAVAWLAARGVAPNRLVLYGESLGSGPAVETARRIQPLGLILECAFTSVPALAPAYVLPPLAHLLTLDRFDNLAKIGAIKSNILIIHGERDATVPVSHAHALLDAAPEAERHIIAGAHHADLWDHGAGDKVIEFVRRLR
jgi:fermentation-respiration switch protein FrsA (DUF1100 family)